MDVSRYHTRQAPKEHEDAVRMLLESLDKRAQQSDLNEAKRKDHQKASTGALVNNQNQHRQFYEQRCEKPMPNVLPSSNSSVDSGSLARGVSGEENSDDLLQDNMPHLQQQQVLENNHHRHQFDSQDDDDDSSSADNIQVSPRIPSKRLHCPVDMRKNVARETNREHLREIFVPKMQSKATSTTTSDTISTASGSRLDLINMHTNQDDLNNGNYEAVPSRTIGIQCDLKVSSVRNNGNRSDSVQCVDSASSDLASMRASSISSTRYGFYKLSPEAYEQRHKLARSISSRNIAHDNNNEDDDHDDDEDTCSLDERRRAIDEEIERELSRVRSRRRQTAGGGGAQQATESPLAPPPPIEWGRHHLLAHKREPRKRIDSLPRRPKTALSYVSTARLRSQHQQMSGSNRSLSNDEQFEEDINYNREKELMNDKLQQQRRRLQPSHQVRAQSQQALHSIARHPDNMFANATTNNSATNSDSELSVDKYRVPHNEEIVLTKRGHHMREAPLEHVTSDTRSDSLNVVVHNQVFRRSATVSARPPMDSHRLLSTTTRTNLCDDLYEGQKLHDDDENCNTTIARGKRLQQMTNIHNAPTSRMHGPQTNLLARTKDRSISQQTLPTSCSAAATTSGRLYSNTNSTCRRNTLGARQRSSCALSSLTPSSKQQQPNLVSNHINRLIGQSNRQHNELRPTNGRKAKLSEQHTKVLHDDDDDSESSPHTRTWANPGRAQQSDNSEQRAAQLELSRSVKSTPCARSTCHLERSDESSASTRFEHIYRTHLSDDDDDDDGRCVDETISLTASYSSGEPQDVARRRNNLSVKPSVVPAAPLDYDSRQRMNEIGLPEPATMTRPRAHHHVASSHLGVSPANWQPANSSERYATIGRHATTTTTMGTQRRGPAVTGRAMSQQSLTRPTMPLSRRLRRAGGGSAASSGSDACGSTLSLASRLRYENAHTRTPVVMYIPQVGGDGAPETRRRSSELTRAGTIGATSGLGRRNSRTLMRTKSTHKSNKTLRANSSNSLMSQERIASNATKRSSGGSSLSRNGSDSESSSSMLRTLMKPRTQTGGGGGVAHHRYQKRSVGATRGAPDNSDEHMDEIGQLASELDSCKFRRRYSVPKDAKINWFSRLKQRVVSAKVN